MDSRFPYDINMEILSRASLKTLDTMRCTSKEFEKLTYDPYLLNQRNNIVSGFLVQKLRVRHGEYTRGHQLFAPTSTHESKTLDLGFLPRNAEILASSEQGIIVFETPLPRAYQMVSYHVCKPATKQLLKLPNPKTKYITANVALVVVGSKPLHYKIVRLSHTKPENGDWKYTSYRFEVFDSRAWTWRQDLVLLPPSVDFVETNEEPITTRGSIYMLLTDQNVLKFDAYSEKWTTLSPPIRTLNNPYYGMRKLVKYQGKLGYACEIPNPSRVCWEIWVLTVDDSWEMLHVFETERSSLVPIYDSDTMVVSNDGYSILYGFKAGDDMSTFRSGDYPSQIFAFRSDFEPEQLKG